MACNKLAKNKKAAIELSIGTVVIIVLAMTMLIMGIVLVKNIFGGATDSVDSSNDKVRSEIASLFTEEGEKIVIYGAGADRTIKIKRGTESFGFVVSAIAEQTTGTDSSKLEYKMELQSDTDCNLVAFKTYFKNPKWTNTGSNILGPMEFDDFDNPQGDALITLSVPDDAETCTQKIRLTVEDSSVPGTTSTPSKSFNIQIISGGFLG